MDFNKTLMKNYKENQGYNQLVYNIKEEVKILKFFICMILILLPFLILILIYLCFNNAKIVQ